MVQESKESFPKII